MITKKSTKIIRNWRHEFIKRLVLHERWWNYMYLMYNVVLHSAIKGFLCGLMRKVTKCKIFITAMKTSKMTSSKTMTSMFYNLCSLRYYHKELSIGSIFLPCAYLEKFNNIQRNVGGFPLGDFRMIRIMCGKSLKDKVT